MILWFGGQHCHTSKVMLRADPDSIFAKSVEEGFPYAPPGKSLFL